MIISKLYLQRSLNKKFTALLARYMGEIGNYALQYLQYVVLTYPRNDISIDMVVIRGDRKLFYSGYGLIEKDIMSFSISDILNILEQHQLWTMGSLYRGGVESILRFPFRNRKKSVHYKRFGLCNT